MIRERLWGAALDASGSDTMTDVRALREQDNHRSNAAFRPACRCQRLRDRQRCRRRRVARPARPVSRADHRVTLDASAVLAWVLRERGFETIDKVLPVAVVPVSAMVEVLYRTVEQGHRRSPAQLHADLLALGLTVEPVTDADAVRAAELIGSSKTTPGPGHFRSATVCA